MTTETAPRTSTETAGAARGLPKASLAESVQVAVMGLLPAVIRGLFAPRRWAMRSLTALDTDRRLVERMTRIRDRRPGEGLKLFGGKLVTLWGERPIRDVLDRSADVYASDAGAKAKGMSHFQPDALTLSRGEEWRDRRTFTEAVLATSERVHPDAERFLAVVADETARLRIGPELDWPAFERLFDAITLRVIFGDRARDDRELTARLERLMGQANRIVATGGRSDDYYELYGSIEHYLRDPQPGTLLARIPQAPQSEETRVAHQVPHWMFAMRDTLAANAYRALAAIVADSAVERGVCGEIDAGDPAAPAAVDSMRYLEGCFEEAMRLWPTTPLLARETTRQTELAGERLEEGTQVILLNTFNHRDTGQVPDADRMVPERWAGGERDYRFNHLSNGTQDCPGGPLVLLLGKAVIAQLLASYRLTLEHPRLAEGEALPHMLDFFAVRFAAEPRG